jgi:hypothetical protein
MIAQQEESAGYPPCAAAVTVSLPYPHRENSTHCRGHRDFPTQGEEKQKIVSEQREG